MRPRVSRVEETLALGRKRRRKYPPPPLVLSSPPPGTDPGMSARERAPPAPRYAPEDPTLPKPWRGLVDGTTGYLYYWNPDTDVTQYERPLPISSAAVPPPDRRRRRSYTPEEPHGRYAPRPRTFHQGGGSGAGSMDMHAANDARDYPAGADTGSAEAYRQRHEIIVIGDNVPPPLPTFQSANFPPEILKESQVRYLLHDGANVVQFKMAPFTLGQCLACACGPALT